MTQTDALRDRFYRLMNDFYSAELQLIRALPDLICAISNDTLQQLLHTCLDESRVQLEAVSSMLEEMEVKTDDATCFSMTRLIAGSETLISRKDKLRTDTLDAVLLTMAQNMERYRIAQYRTLCAFADEIGMTH